MVRREVLVLVLQAGILCSCAGPAEPSPAPFDPEYFKHSEHFALQLTLEDGELTLADPPIERRSGPAPFRTPDGWPVTLIYRDSAGDELGRYAIQDPRPFEPDGRLEYQLPSDPRIATVEIGPLDKRVFRFDVAAALRSAARR